MTENTTNPDVLRPLIGVVSFQGDFERHIQVLQKVGAQTREVRLPEQIPGLQGLVIPGGESTTIGMLMERYGLLAAVQRAAQEDGLAVFGTCAGMILLARDIEGSTQPRLALLPITVRRNAYGRQLESFEAQLSSESFAGGPLEGVFIRAPQVTEYDPGVEILASFETKPILVRHGRVLAASFHPELTQDTRIHQYFLDMAIGS